MVYWFILFMICLASSCSSSNSSSSTSSGGPTDTPYSETCTPALEANASEEADSLPSHVELEEPTFHTLGVQWWIGDSGHDAMAVEVDYREVGASTWCMGMPLFRVETEAIIETEIPSNHTLYAGSLFYLKPGTEYEIKLRKIPENGSPTVFGYTQSTRPEPEAPHPLRTLHVTPGSGGGTGTESDPFLGLAAANESSQPGDLFLIHAGTYASVSLSHDGTEAAPIVWKAAGDGDVVIEPDTYYGIALYHRAHVFIEGMNVRNAEHGIIVAAAHDLVIRNNHLQDVSHGIFGDAEGQARLVIIDNVVDGGGSSHRGIELGGFGHIIAYNEVKGFGDCIVTRDPWPLRGIDIHNNEISECGDDAIELDFSQHNVRAFKNRITNTGTGISFQPSAGGPNYALHNSFYNIGRHGSASEVFKLHLNIGTSDRTSGGVMFHNTVMKTDVAFRVWSNEGPAHYFTLKNNLMLGLPAQFAMELSPLPVRFADFDYNAWAETSSFAVVPDWGVTYDNPYRTLSQFQNETNLEQHSLIVDDVETVFSNSIVFPEGIDTTYEKQDLRLQNNAPVIDQGLLLPGINSDFDGEAPDMGAYEVGQDLPQYGPRA